jgi:hypothetical protein
VPVRASKETPHGVTTNEPARAVLAGVRTGNRRENAA